MMKAVTKKNCKAIIINKKGGRVREFVSHTSCFPKVILPRATSESLAASEIPGRFRNNQSCNAEFDHVDNPSGCTTHLHTQLVANI